MNGTGLSGVFPTPGANPSVRSQLGPAVGECASCPFLNTYDHVPIFQRISGNRINRKTGLKKEGIRTRPADEYGFHLIPIFAGRRWFASRQPRVGREWFSRGTIQWASLASGEAIRDGRPGNGPPVRLFGRSEVNPPTGVAGRNASVRRWSPGASCSKSGCGKCPRFSR